MITKAIIAVIVIIAVIAASHTAAATRDEDYAPKYQPSYWQGFKNALSDMNPFGSKLGHDWQDTQYKVEEILSKTHLEAQKKVADLKEDSLKDQKDLQEKIRDIYLAAANDAERQIERLKRPLIASLWRGAEHDKDEFDYDSDYPTHGGVRHLYDKTKEGLKEGIDKTFDKTKEGMKEGYDKAKEGMKDFGDRISDTANSMKKKLTRHEQTTLFEDAQKSIRETYDKAILKAKEGLAATPSPSETLQDTKKRAQKMYDDVFHGSKLTSRTTFEKLRDKLNRGMHTMGGGVASAAVKTWHLFLHLLLGSFWMVFGVLAYTGIKWWMEKYTFNRQLNAHVQGPVVLSKVFTVLGTEETQRKFEEYWSGPAAGFFSRQNGVRKFSLQRGVNIGSNVWCHLSEWDSIDALRKMINNPELNEIKKRMPKGVMTKRMVSQVVSTGKGVNMGTTGGTEGDIRSEGLRNRGPGTATSS